MMRTPIIAIFPTIASNYKIELLYFPLFGIVVAFFPFFLSLCQFSCDFSMHFLPYFGQVVCFPRVLFCHINVHICSGIVFRRCICVLYIWT